MNLKEQVLSIDQVRELQELGFDVEKYASMCWIGVEDKYRLTIFDTWCLEKTCLGTIPTLTIGDIMDILPTFIKAHDRNYILVVNNIAVSYSCNGLLTFSIEDFNLIDALFETLKWCIKQKHIEL